MTNPYPFMYEPPASDEPDFAFDDEQDDVPLASFARSAQVHSDALGEEDYRRPNTRPPVSAPARPGYYPHGYAP